MIAPENRYAYDPYGESQGAANPTGSAAGHNPFRFEGFYHDAETKTYDMQARQYRPDIGRFLSQDRYESSTGDLSLQSDPLTQNRYAFAGGNPVSRVEWDGHRHRTGRIGSNGCGPVGNGIGIYVGTRLILDKLPGVFNFRRFCNQHDRNYGTFHARRRGLSRSDSHFKTRLHYDRIALRQLVRHCRRRHGRFNPLRASCLGYAAIYYSQIRAHSGPSYLAGQRGGLRLAKRGHSRRYFPQ
jgi:RHS repeat-associated protein